MPAIELIQFTEATPVALAVEGPLPATHGRPSVHIAALGLLGSSAASRRRSSAGVAPSRS
jgi:hypothetical protein